ncbi:MAG: hypothetical protein D6741_15525, partial [Planctomycetota bacterium]
RLPHFVSALVLVLGLGYCVPVQAQVGAAAKQGDERIGKLLDEINWKYEVDSDGDYKLIFRFEDDRTQIVFVNSNTSKLGPLEIREVWAPSFRMGPNPRPADNQALLEANDKVKLGAWRVVKAGDDYVAVFAIQIAADADRETLRTAVDAASVTADQMEQKYSQEDEF